ncbi:MAG: GNAT family N-acetyltransferase [Solirubrobacteraceae bacterium]
MPAIPELPAPLSDGTVHLRFAAERDIPEVLIAYQDDPELHVRLGEDRPPSGAQLGTRSERAEADRADGIRATLTVLESGSERCRGQVTVQKLDWGHRRAELGVWLAPQVRGRGYAPRALRLSADWLFSSAGLERLQLLTQPDNEAMIAAARSAGFALEGVLRGYERERGGRVDLAILSLLPRDLEP